VSTLNQFPSEAGDVDVGECSGNQKQQMDTGDKVRIHVYALLYWERSTYMQQALSRLTISVPRLHSTLDN
jgi:hypothetical protein